MTMSSGSTGRDRPSSPCTGNFSSSSCRMRRAVNRASISVRSKLSSWVFSTLMKCSSGSMPGRGGYAASAPKYSCSSSP